MRETFPAYMPQLFKHEGDYVDYSRNVAFNYIIKT